MKKMKLFGATMVMALGLVGLASCADDEKPTDDKTTDVAKDMVDVMFYDGDTLLKTDKVEKGKKATSYVPEKEGYTFTGWYATPNFVHKFDFDSDVTKPTKVFALFSKAEQREDTRVFYVVGSGTSSLLRKSNWGKVIDDSMKMTKTEGKNEYKITLNLKKDDEFQFALNKDWHNQKGYGYLDTNKLADGTECFKSSQTIGDNSSLRINIKVIKDGNYTFTLATHPDDDTYETKNPSYKEENKEAFNINYNDKITWVRNGDVTEEAVETIVEYYIKGASITEWKNLYNKNTQLSVADGKASLEVYLKKSDQFLITSRFIIGDEAPVEGNIYVKGSSLDEASKPLFTVLQNGNMEVKESGTYKLVVDTKTNALSATLDKEKAPAKADYYIDGTFGETSWDGYCFNEKFKLTEEKSGNYVISNVAMKKDSEFIIQAFKENSTERGEWGKPSYNGLGSYNYTYTDGTNTAFEPVSATNKNIKVKEAGNYDIKFNSYSKLITITKHVEGNDTLDIFVKGGGINGWNHAFDQQYKMTLNEAGTAYEFTLVVTAPVEFGLAVYPKGTATGNGTFKGKNDLGTAGDANEAFKGKNNLATEVNGTYKVVYTIATEKIDIYTVE